MSHFRPLFSIKVEHGFFQSGLCDCLEFVPTEASRKIIQNSGLLMRATQGGFCVDYDDTRLEALQLYAEEPDQPLALEFKVFSRHPEFKTYTEPFAGVEQGCLYFSNESNQDISDGASTLHHQRYVSKMDLAPLDSAQLKGKLSQKERHIPPIAVLKITADASKNGFLDEQLQPRFKSYGIHFQSRETIWKYFLLSKSASDSTYIEDPDNRIEFEPSGTATLADQRIAKTFRSKQSIPLQERFEHCSFQLKEKAPGGSKVIVKRLPVARVNQTGKEVVAEHGIVVSEIFVNI